MRRFDGFTIVEMLIALAVIGIALAGLAATQFTALRINVQSHTLSDAKSEANLLLESLSTEVLRVTDVNVGNVLDDDGQGHRYWFVDYYWSCPTKQKPEGLRNDAVTNLNAGEPCSRTDIVSASGDVMTSYAIRGSEGVRGEGVITIAVTSTHESGASVTVGTAITCFEVYPSPTSEAPSPCPVPTDDGGGRDASV